MADLGSIGTSNGISSFSGGKTITGTVKDSAGSFVRRPVHFFVESGGQDVAGLYERTAYSDPSTGVYTAPFGDTNPRTVLVSGESGKNGLVLAHVVPQ